MLAERQPPARSTASNWGAFNSGTALPFCLGRTKYSRRGRALEYFS